MKEMRYFLAAFVISMVPVIGCATHTRTVQTETVHPVTHNGYVVERETRTETTRPDSGGVVSSTVDTVGEVLALPFRLVGGAIRAIF